ncbi:MAG TPA: FAD-dependent oxidoreductase [Thermoanaerobaculia bacterium]|nr:FAD-dependent oxidoreductase [Thermoanaerobaculia bacterium]
MTTVAVAGAGVAGLTCGVVLSEAGFDVTLFAAEVEATTSAVAAAIWYPYHIEPRHKVERWARASYRQFEKLARVRGSGVSMVEFDVDGERITVPLIETPIYLPWLRRTLRIRRKTIRDLRALDADVVVNCTGLGARELCGDGDLRPGRGVVLRTRNPGIVRHAVVMEPLTYVLTRTDDVVLGGTDDDVESRDVPRALAEKIYARCKAVEPRLPAELGVDVGFRPLRSAVRLEREGNVIHNYGHGGAGFTVSWGCARDVLRLTRSAVRRRSTPASRRRR